MLITLVTNCLRKSQRVKKGESISSGQDCCISLDDRSSSEVTLCQQLVYFSCECICTEFSKYVSPHICIISFYNHNLLYFNPYLLGLSTCFKKRLFRGLHLEGKVPSWDSHRIYGTENPVSCSIHSGLRLALILAMN